MSELTPNQTTNELSTDIHIITAEINAYQRVAGEAIFEIGRRLKHVKENDLAHGDWTKFCESVRMEVRQANKFIRVVDELGGEWSTSTTLGMEALYQIATLPPEHRESEHTTSAGETKTPDEMTVRELRELKRKLKETEKQAEAERKERERLEEENEELAEKADKPAEIKYERIEVEVAPYDYEESKSRLLEYEGKFGDIRNYDEAITATHRQDMIVAVMSFSKGVREFIKRYDYMNRYKSVVNNLDVESKTQYNEAVQALKSLAESFGYTEDIGDVIDADFSEIN